MLIYFIYNFEHKTSAIYETYPQALPEKLKRIGWDYNECMIRIAPDLSYAIRTRDLAKEHPEKFDENLKGMVLDARQPIGHRQALPFGVYTMTRGKGIDYV